VKSKVIEFAVRAGTFPTVVFVAHCIFSLGFNAYDRIAWLDVVMHIIGGIAIAYFFDYAIGLLNDIASLGVDKHAARLVMVLGLVAIAVVFWEFAEFLADTFFNAGAQRSISNIMKDQFFGLLGGAVYVAGQVIRRGITSGSTVALSGQ
jgi:hypothetical protein